MAVKKEDVLAYLENANMMEVSELISEIEEKFGVSAAAPVAVAAAPVAGEVIKLVAPILSIPIQNNFSVFQEHARVDN